VIQKKLNQRHLSAVCVALITGWANAGIAGPPYVTDDPAPTDTDHWEIYNFIRFLARNPSVEAGEVSERARRVVPAGI
jgi:hypothetical protein